MGGFQRGISGQVLLKLSFRCVLFDDIQATICKLLVGVQARQRLSEHGKAYHVYIRIAALSW